MDSPELINDREAWCERHLKKFSRRQDSTWADALCPIHKEDKPSLTINLETGGFKCLGCNETGVLPELARKAGLDLTGLPVIGKPTGKAGRPARETVAEYIYDDIDGTHVFKVSRYEPKDFRQFRWEGAEWKPGLASNTVRLPYRLRDIAKLKPGTTVLWVEGEKDVDLAWKLGIPATTTPQGAKSLGKIRNVDLEVFKELKILVVPDNDKDGREYGEAVLGRLHPIAQWVGRLELKGLPPKGDFSDHVASCRSQKMTDSAIGSGLYKLAKEVQEWSPTPHEGLVEIKTALVDPGSVHKGELHSLHLPMVQVNDIPPSVLLKTVLRLISTSNAQQLRFVWSAGGFTYLDRDSDRPLIQLTPKGLRVRLDWIINFVKWRKNEECNQVTVKCESPPIVLCESLCELPRSILGVPEVEQIVNVPIFGQDGELIDKPGYHEKHKVLYSPDRDLVIHVVPKNPSKADVKRALGFLLEVLRDFNFVSPADLATALAIAISLFVRRLTGLCPLFVVEASTPGTGKSLLVAILLGIFLGFDQGHGRQGLCLIGGLEADQERVQKQLTAALLLSPLAIWIDNQIGRIDNGFLCMILTTLAYEDRMLGTSRTVRLLNLAIWVLTANNPTLSDEVARRSVSCRIDAGLERPDNRTNFTHADLLGWCKQNRGNLIWSVLVLVQNWISQGKPKGHAVLGSFQPWADVMGGILGCAGVDGFLGNREQTLQRFDLDREEWTFFTQAWKERHGSQRVTVTDLVDIVRRKHVPSKVFGKPSEQSQITALGQALVKQAGRIFGGLRIERLGLSSGVSGYRLILVESQSTLVDCQEVLDFRNSELGDLEPEGCRSTRSTKIVAKLDVNKVSAMVGLQEQAHHEAHQDANLEGFAEEMVF